MNRRGRPPHPDVLTPREWEVLALLREELTDQAIADRLGISLDGAKYHVREILSKLGVTSRQEAAAWHPEERASARRWMVLPLAARIAGALVVVAAIGGLGLLAWGVLRTNDDGDVLQILASPTPIHEGGGGSLVWQRTGEYRAESADVVLTILEFTIDSNAHVEYALTHADPKTAVSPGDLRLSDNDGRTFPLVRQAAVGEALGVTVWRSTFARPPDAGETLTFAFTDAEISRTSGGQTSIAGSWEVSFIRNVDTGPSCCYTEGHRIVESTISHGASLLYGGGFTRITREGEPAKLPW